MIIRSLKSTKNTLGFWCWFVVGSVLNPYDMLKPDNYIFVVCILFICLILQTWLHLSKAEGQFYGDLKSGK